MAIPMGRRRTRDFDLPPLMIRRRGRYYYGRQQIALGHDFRAALRKYAELHTGHAQPGTFADATDLFRKSPQGLCARAANTQVQYSRQLDILVGAFGTMHLDRIHPRDVYDFVRAASVPQDDSNRGGAIAATRMKALLSLVFNFARESGLTNAPNPCIGIKGKKSEREVYVEDAELAAVLAHCDRPTATFLELCYRTGADASVVLKLTLRDVQDGTLRVRRTKTGARVAIAIEGPLKAILDGLRDRPVASVYLVADDRGQPFTLQTIRARFWIARRKAGVTWQIRDLRAKAATDAEDIGAARSLLGHARETTTALYRRKRAGEKARPIARKIAGK